VVPAPVRDKVIVYYEQPPRREMLVGVSASTLRTSFFWYENSWWGYNDPLGTYVLLTDNSFLGRCSEYNVYGHRNWGLGSGGHSGRYHHGEFSGRSADSYSPAITIVEHSHRGRGSYRGGGRGGEWNRTDSVRPPARTERRVINTSTGSHRSREVTRVHSVAQTPTRKSERAVYQSSESRSVRQTPIGRGRGSVRTPVRTERVVRNTSTGNYRSREVTGVRSVSQAPTRRSERVVNTRQPQRSAVQQRPQARQQVVASRQQRVERVASPGRQQVVQRTQPSQVARQHTVARPQQVARKPQQVVQRAHSVAPRSGAQVVRRK